MRKIESKCPTFAFALILAGLLLSAQRVHGQTNRARTPRATAIATKRRPVASARSGSLSPDARVSNVEARLSELGYWTGNVDGRFDAESRSALIAFQKAEGLPRTGRLSAADIRAMDRASRIIPRERGYYHVEVDLDRQILFLVGSDDRVSNILPISTGGGEEFTSEGWTRQAITPVGRFRVHEKIDGWHKGPLGSIYYPNYILGGLAIHGYPSVPMHPASHGCIRIPMFAAKKFSEMTPIGTAVLVYGARPAMPPETTTERRTVAKSND